MRILVGCESSGRVREAVRALGHEAWSCDLLPADDGSPWHFQCDVRHVLHAMRGYFDGFVVHPECTYLCGSGWHWVARGRIEDDGRPRIEHYREALAFALWCMSVDVPRIIMENPIGRLSTEYRKPDQIIQPWQFGDDASKATCLWLKGVPKLTINPARAFPPRYVCKGCKSVSQRWSGACSSCGSEEASERWSNQTDSGQNVLGPSDDRWKLRSETYPGIARALAEAITHGA
jgi:hypothetical protein